MAGQPITRSYMNHLNEIDKKDSIDRRIIEAIDNGHSFNQIVQGRVKGLEDFSRPNKKGLTWHLFYKWLNKPREGQEKGAFYNEVMRLREERQRESAYMVMEEALDIVDNAEPITEEIQKAKLQLEARRWKAGTFNSQFKANATNDIKVNISTQDLHLEALKNNK